MNRSRRTRRVLSRSSGRTAIVITTWRRILPGMLQSRTRMGCRVGIPVVLGTPNAAGGVLPVSRTTNTSQNHDKAIVSGTETGANGTSPAVHHRIIRLQSSTYSTNLVCRGKQTIEYQSDMRVCDALAQNPPQPNRKQRLGFKTPLGSGGSVDPGELDTAAPAPGSADDTQRGR